MIAVATALPLASASAEGPISLILATRGPFMAYEKFVVGAGPLVRLADFDYQFSQKFLGKVEGPINDSVLYRRILSAPEYDSAIIRRAGGDQGIVSSLTAVYQVFQSGVLTTTTLANVFYVFDVNRELKSVSFYFSPTGYNIRVYPVDDSEPWQAGCQIFTPNPDQPGL